MTNLIQVTESDKDPELRFPSGIAGRSKWLVLPMFLFYFVLAILLFFYWVEPSLNGQNSRHITADSSKYIYFGDSLREGRVDAYVAGALYSFPNTVWGPTLLAYLLPNHFYMMLLNVGILLLCLWLFSSTIDMDSRVFLFLLFLNPTTVISLLAVNKEILDILALALFLYHLRHQNRILLSLALGISLISRYETCITMTIFLFFRSQWNPWRGRRWKSLLAFCILLNVMIALLLNSPSQAYRLEEAAGAAGGVVASSGILLVLNSLEIHFLFVIAMLPKILDNLFAEVFNISHWFAFTMEDPANTFLLFGNNLANLVLVLVLFFQRRLSLRSSILYYAALIAIAMSVSVVIQPRYFFTVYALFCLEAARRIPPRSIKDFGRNIYAAA